MPIFATPTVWIALMNVVNSVAFATAVTATLNFIAITAASMAASKLLAPKAPSFSDSSLLDRNQTIRSPIAARTIIYGQCKTSGVLVYISTTGDKNEYLHMVIALAGHEVEEIGDVYFNDELVLTGGGSSATGKYAGYAEIYKKLGGDTQTVETNLEAATSTLTDGKWTSNHRLRGIAYVYVRLKWNAEIFVGGIPNVSAIVKGKKVWDPRTSTTAYSANAALCLRDYLTDTRLGLAMDASEIDDTSFIVAANICDEQVQVLPLSPTTYENRYETNGVVSTAETPDGNIGKLLSAMGGLIAYSGGKVVPYAGNYRIPAVTLTEKHFVGAINVQTKTSARDRVNGVKGVFVAPENNWQVTDFPPITSTTYVTQDNGIKYWRDVTLPLTTSASCAQRLSVIELRRARQEITMTARFRLEAMQIRAGDTVMISNEKLGWSQKIFEVVEWHFVSDGSPPQLAIEMTLRETDSTVYSWSVGDEVAVPTAPKTTLPDPFTLDAPTNLALTADGTTQLIQADGTAIPRIKVAWSAPSEQFIQAGGNVVIEYKQGNATTYLTWSRVDGDQTLDYISSDIRIGTSYDVRIYGESYFKVSTSYLSASITVAKDTTAPSAPTGLTITAGNGLALSLDWDDNTETDFSEYGVYRNTSGTTPANANTDKIAETRSSRFVDTQVTIGTTYYYWVNAYDMVENVSGFSSRVSALATAVTGTLDTTAPGTPSAPTYSSETTYTATDGSVFSSVVLNVPAMPTLGVVMNILYRTNSSSTWLVAGQVTAGGGTFSVDDLSPGIAYVFAAQAFSYYSIASAVSATLSRSAPTKTTAPSAPTAGGVNGACATALNWSVSSIYFGARAYWNAVTNSDFDHYEIKCTVDNNDGSTDYRWFSANGTPQTYITKELFFDYYRTTSSLGYVRVRAVNTSGVASAWTYLGELSTVAGAVAGDAARKNTGTITGTVAAGDDSRITGSAQKANNLSDLTNTTTARSNLGLGTIATQAASNVAVTGGTVEGITSLKVGTGSSTSSTKVRYVGFVDVTLTGSYGASEPFDISLTNRGFSAKPDCGILSSIDPGYVVVYDRTNASSTSTNARCTIKSTDGSNIPATTTPIMFIFEDI